VVDADDALIQAGALVNGTTTIGETRVPETFIYCHIELNDDSLILPRTQQRKSSSIV
jgi:hypothetical protein